MSTAIATIAVMTAAGFCAPTAHAAARIEGTYQAPGVLTVTWDDGRELGCEAPRTQQPGGHTVIYPNDPASGPHPIVVWGNGTGFGTDSTCSYHDALVHLASWGFVVVAPNSGAVGDGTALLAAVDHAVELNDDPSSPLHNRLDTDRIAAVGHSQGAGGAVTAARSSAGRIVSVVALAFADPTPLWWWPVGLPVPTAAGLSAPIFLVRGTGDWLATERGQRIYFDQVSGAAAKAALVGGDHLDLTGALGYVTAWLRYSLAGYVFARRAFVGDGAGPPELATNIAPGGHWREVALKNLPFCAGCPPGS
ncbi:poly(ethylene terephthalate) hydrolase family protein [Rhodococcus sp. NPDC054953]